MIPTLCDRWVYPIQVVIGSEPEAFSMTGLMDQRLTVQHPCQISCPQESSLKPHGSDRLRDDQAMPILEETLG